MLSVQTQTYTHAHSLSGHNCFLRSFPCNQKLTSVQDMSQDTHNSCSLFCFGICGKEVSHKRNMCATNQTPFHTDCESEEVERKRLSVPKHDSGQQISLPTRTREATPSYLMSKSRNTGRKLHMGQSEEKISLLSV